MGAPAVCSSDYINLFRFRVCHCQWETAVVTVTVDRPMQRDGIISFHLSGPMSHRPCQSRKWLIESIQRLPYAAQTDKPLPNEFGSGNLALKQRWQETLFRCFLSCSLFCCILRSYYFIYYGRPLSVSGRPCYILPMFFY